MRAILYALLVVSAAAVLACCLLLATATTAMGAYVALIGLLVSLMVGMLTVDRLTERGL